MTTPTTVRYVISRGTIALHMDGREFTIPSDHANFARIKEILTTKTGYDQLADLMDLRSSVRKFFSSTKLVELKDDVIKVVKDGHAFSHAVTDKVLRMIEAGNDAMPIISFLLKVRENPSKTAQKELFLFCTANGFMIHEDGDIIAYKSVRDDYKDIHSGTFDNSVGKVLEMPRGDVDDNRHNTCSNGFHFAAHNYASNWAGQEGKRLMVMKVNPRDVVAVPADYHNQKARTCRYEVIGELPFNTRLSPSEVYGANDLASINAEKLKATNEKIAKIRESITKLEARRDEVGAQAKATAVVAGSASPSQLNEVAQIVAEIASLEKRIVELTPKAPVPAAPESLQP